MPSRKPARDLTAVDVRWLAARLAELQEPSGQVRWMDGTSMLAWLDDKHLHTAIKIDGFLVVEAHKRYHPHVACRGKGCATVVGVLFLTGEGMRCRRCANVTYRQPTGTKKPDATYRLVPMPRQ